MLRIRKSTLRWAGITTLVMIVAAALMARVGAAAGGVNITTPPLRTGQAIYFDADGDGISDPEELVGTFTVYDGNQAINFNWTPYAFSSGVNGSYRVALVQNINPLGTAVWQEVVIGHHWASNPNGTSYTMGPFDPNRVCTYCPSHFSVQPETYTHLYDPTTQTYEYEYTAIPAALGGQAASLEQSTDFTFEIFNVGPSDRGNPNACLNCTSACNQLQEQCQDEICGGEPCEACEFSGECMGVCTSPEGPDFFELEFGICVSNDGPGPGGCQDAWETYCELVTETEEDFLDCLDDYEGAVDAGFCEACADDPESCAGEGYTTRFYSQGQ